MEAAGVDDFRTKRVAMSRPPIDAAQYQSRGDAPEEAIVWDHGKEPVAIMARSILALVNGMTKRLRFLPLLSAIAPALLLGVAPIHVKEPFQPDLPAMAGSTPKDGRDARNPELPHAHVPVHITSKDIWYATREGIRKWNERCDRVIRSGGALGQIALFDLSLPPELAPLNLQHCKVKSPYAPGSRHDVEIVLLDTLRMDHDEAALKSIHAMLLAGHDSGDSDGPLTSVLGYLAVRSSKKCLPGSQLLCLRAKAEAQPHNHRAKEEYLGFLGLLRQVATEHIRRPAKPDWEVLKIAKSKMTMEAQIEGYSLDVIGRAVTLLNECIEQPPNPPIERTGPAASRPARRSSR
jgi:hypothetical protein